jgi:hypothetical protein
MCSSISIDGIQWNEHIARASPASCPSAKRQHT